MLLFRYLIKTIICKILSTFIRWCTQKVFLCCSVWNRTCSVRKLLFSRLNTNCDVDIVFMRANKNAIYSRKIFICSSSAWIWTSFVHVWQPKWIPLGQWTTISDHHFCIKSDEIYIVNNFRCLVTLHCKFACFVVQTCSAWGERFFELCGSFGFSWKWSQSVSWASITSNTELRLFFVIVWITGRLL